ncbi:MAG: hypothetical protein GC154_01400 [bacterium]|nr:hypothetical protein [bacterium]
MVIREHLLNLANGNGDAIIQNMNHELEDVVSLMKRFSITVETLPPEKKMLWMDAQNTVRASEKHAITLDTHLKRIRILEGKKGVVEILKLEDEKKTANSPAAFGRINRQLTHLKDVHAREMSELISNRHQALLIRIQLVDRWKSLLASEIQLLEACRLHVVNFALSAAEDSGDHSFLETVKTKLQSLMSGIDQAQFTKINTSTLHSANFHVLKKTVLHQLDEIVKIEKKIVERKETLQQVSAIFSDLKMQMPEPDIAPPLADEIAAPQQNQPDPPPSQPGDTPPASSRMAFRDKQND